MKNSFIIITLIFFFQCQAGAQNFTFETEKIKILDNGNVIQANNGKVILKNDNTEISAINFNYDKVEKILKIDGSGEIINTNKNINISFDKAIFYEKENLLEVQNQIHIKKNKQNLTIKTKKILYNLNNKFLKSDFKTLITSEDQGTYYADSFFYELNKNLLKVNNLELIDNNNNKIKTSIAYINTETMNFFGKDINLKFNKDNFNKENDPRMSGNAIINNKEKTTVTKGVFSTCKITDDCPPWQISAKKIEHDKIKKTINYNDAILKVYDVPIMYFPKFFHPDPTVKRQTGFLTPKINSSSNKSYFGIPYFLAIADNKDATFIPRIYDNKDVLFQTEYRHIGRDDNFITDFSFYNNDFSQTKSHIFYEYEKQFDFKTFDQSSLNFKMQNTSNDTYLRAENIVSDLKENMNIMENSLGLNLFSNNLSMNFEASAYEDLNKGKSDRYEYIIPSFNFVKQFDNFKDLDGKLSLSSKNQVRNYSTNVYEKFNINDLIFKSNPIISKYGFYNNYEFIVRNTNSSADKSSKFKNKDNAYLSSIFQFNSNYPLINNQSEKYKKILKPKIALNLAPNHTKDLSTQDKKFNVNNIYSIDRLGEIDTVEGGTSLVLGSSYSLTNKENSNEILALEIANNLRPKINEDLPNNNQIGEKISNLYSNIIFRPNKYIDLNYNNSYKNNFSDINYENLIADFNIQNLVISFDYLNENNTVDKNSYLSNKTTYNFNKSNNFSFSTRRNKKKDLTEYYNMMYQYKNDCLSASINYKKEYYSDKDINPSEGIYFELSIIPLTSLSGPQINK